MNWYKIHLATLGKIDAHLHVITEHLSRKITLNPLLKGLAIFSRRNKRDWSLDIYVSPELSIANLQFLKRWGGVACEKPERTHLRFVRGNHEAWQYLHL